MLKIEDFWSSDVKEKELYFRCFDKGTKEINLLFKYDLSKDNVWYEITIGDIGTPDGYIEKEKHIFHSIKKAVKWWNDYFGENEE